MDIFGFISWCLVTVAAVTVLWPVNVPLLALAYKVFLGGKPVPLETREFWLRATFGALGLALMTAACLGLVYATVTGLELPAGYVQATFLAVYLVAAIGFLFWILALEDTLQAASVFVTYVLLSGLPLLLVGRLTGFWAGLRQSAAWLLPPT